MGGLGVFHVAPTAFYYDGDLMEIAYQVEGAPVRFRDETGRETGFVEVIARIVSINGQTVDNGSCMTAGPDTYRDGVQVGTVSAGHLLQSATGTVEVELNFTAEQFYTVEPNTLPYGERTLASGNGTFMLPIQDNSGKVRSIDVGKTVPLPLFDMTVQTLRFMPTETTMEFTLTNIDIETLKPYTQDGLIPPVLWAATPEGKEYIVTKWVDVYDKSTAEFTSESTSLPIFAEIPASLELFWKTELGEEIPNTRFQVALHAG